MALCVRLLPGVFAVAIGVAPPAVIPLPVQPAVLPKAHVATQASGTNTGFAAAPMPGASATGPLSPFIRLETHIGSTAEQRTGFLRAQAGHAATSPAPGLLLSCGAFLLAAISTWAAAGLWWSHRRRHCDTMEGTELGTVKNKFPVGPHDKLAVAAFTSEPRAPLCVAVEKTAAEVENGRAITACIAQNILKLPGFDGTAAAQRPGLDSIARLGAVASGSPANLAGAALAASVGASAVPGIARGTPRGLLRLCAVDKDSADAAEVVMLEEDGEESDGEAGEAAYLEEGYSLDEPSSEWYDKRVIDKHKVNMVFFDMFKKPTSFFPHKLMPGDTIRIYYMTPAPQGDQQHGRIRKLEPSEFRETYFDGIIMGFKGDYHQRKMTLRAMVGKNEHTMGMEIRVPIHSPALTKIELLRRGYIGQNKNAYWLRCMVGKKNAIPLDQERTAMDDAYEDLRNIRRADEIPEPEYPKVEHEIYPLPVWKQFADDWDEAKYRPQDVDQRTEYERRVIGVFKKRLNPSGRYGRRGTKGSGQNDS